MTKGTNRLWSFHSSINPNAHKLKCIRRIFHAMLCHCFYSKSFEIRVGCTSKMSQKRLNVFPSQKCAIYSTNLSNERRKCWAQLASIASNRGWMLCERSGKGRRKRTRIYIGLVRLSFYSGVPDQWWRILPFFHLCPAFFLSSPPQWRPNEKWRSSKDAPFSYHCGNPFYYYFHYTAVCGRIVCERLSFDTGCKKNSVCM